MGVLIGAAMAARKAQSQTSGKQMPGNKGGSPGKLVSPSVLRAVKASPSGMFPAVAAKSGISIGSKLGQAIAKSGAGKLPAQLQSYNNNAKKIAALQSQRRK